MPFCASCGKELPVEGLKFCPFCGRSATASGTQQPVVETPVPPTVSLPTVAAGRFCTNCGSPLAANVKFCGKCGTSNPEAAVTPAMAVSQTPVEFKRFCSSCGTSYKEGTKFCQNCGTNLQVGQVQHVSNPQARPTRAWYLVPFFFTILGGIVGYVAVRNKDRSMANKLLIFGVLMFVVPLALVLLYVFSIGLVGPK